MNGKRIFSAALAAAMLCGVLTFPASASNKVSVFSDITDAATGEAVETLRLLGIVDGTGNGEFEPSRALTRAAFCKMAVELMDDGDKVPAQMNRTIYPDVPSTYWARGYINVATQSSTKEDDSSAATSGIMRGDASGYFHPDRNISFAEAVTILMRVLGYKDDDVGAVWPDGYLNTARSIDLTDGVPLSAGDSITRGQAALLFENVLYLKPKDSENLYLTTLGGSRTEEELVLDVDATATDGSGGAVKTADGKTYQTDRAPFSTDLVGCKAKLVLDEDSHVLAIQPTDQGTQKTVNIISLKYDAIKGTGGESITIDKPASAVVWRNGESTTFDKLYLEGVRSGTQALLQYSAEGDLEYVFLRDTVSASDNSTIVLRSMGSASNVKYQIYKNGVPATAADLRQYDVMTYEKDTNSVYVSDLQVTGIYENVYPNRETPAYITVMGHKFPVLPGAASDLSGFKIGDSITLLLSCDGQVAGAVKPRVASSTLVGIIDKIDGDGTATVTPLVDLRDASDDPITFTGATSLSDQRAEQMVGRLVTISSGQVGRLSLSVLSGSGSKSSLDVSGRKLGAVPLADDAQLYEQVGTSKLGKIELDDITRASVPASQILYVHTNYAGKADIVVFNDITGDQYTYGFIRFTSAEDTDPEDVDSISNATISVTNSEGTGEALLCGHSYSSSVPGGIAASTATGQDGSHVLAGYVKLKMMKNVSTDTLNLDAQTLSLTNIVYPIADNVQCYNDTTKAWFTVPEGGDAMDALSQARAYADTMTVYYDKAPSEGGKIRLVVVE